MGKQGAVQDQGKNHWWIRETSQIRKDTPGELIQGQWLNWGIIDSTQVSVDTSKDLEIFLVGVHNPQNKGNI